MKAVVLVVATPDGKLMSVASATAEAILDLATTCRTTGEFDGKKIVAGCVLHSERLNPVRQFRCVDPDLAAKKAAAEKAAAEEKAKAEKAAAKEKAKAEKAAAEEKAKAEKAAAKEKAKAEKAAAEEKAKAEKAAAKEKAKDEKPEEK